MLQKTNFFISLAQGISTKEDPKQVIPGRLLTLENGVFISPKEIQKRNGHSALSLSTQNNISITDFNTVPEKINTGNFLSVFNKEIVLNDKFNFYSYSDSLNNWIYKAPNTICNVAVTSVIRNMNSETLADSAISPNGLQVFAWEESVSGNVHISIIDVKTDQVIIVDRQISPIGGGNTVKPKCAYLNGNLIIFYLDTTTNMELRYITYNNGIFSSSVLITSIVNIADNNYDIVVGNNSLYLTYNTNATSIQTLYFNAFLQSSQSNTQPGVSASSCINIFIDASDNVWVAYATSTTVNIFIMDSSLVHTVLPSTLVDTVSGVYNITGLETDLQFATIFYDILGSTDSEGYKSDSIIYYNRVHSTGISTGQKLFIRSASLQSKCFPIIVQNIIIPHVTIVHDAALQPTYFLCNLYNINTGNSLPEASVVSKIAANSAGGIPTKKSSLANVNLFSDNVFQTALLQKDLLYTSVSSTGTVNTYSQTGVISTSFDFTATNLNNVTLGQNLHISSGIISMYDGANVVEHNFHLYPEAITTTVNTSGGSLTDSSTYGYQITYEWTDNQGQLHRSAPSPVVSITTGSSSNSSQVVLVIPTLRITSKSNVTIVVYRTQANGAIYYRLNLPSSPLYNSTITDSVTYTDNASDASIAANEQIYTTGGEVENSAAPAASIMGEYKNRIILIPSDSPYSWWYSKQVIPGSPVEFSGVFVENIGTEGGPITAVIQMDSNAIFFKENSIYYVVGDGPSPSGANNDFTQALSIASDVGCINSQSLILMPTGIVFKSNKGIYLLTRALTVEYIGSDVEVFNNNAVTSAQLISYTNQIRFTLDNGIILMFDYFVNQWSVFTELNAVSSAINNDVFAFLQPNGLVLQESQGTYTDNGAFIKLKLVTSWLSLDGIQGFQRVYKALILGQYFGPHKLLVQFAYDFNPTNTQETYIDATTALNSNIYGQDPFYGTNSPYGGSYPTYQWRVFTDRQVCESLQMTIEDVPFAGPYTNSQGNIINAQYNESLSLSAISFELGLKRGLNKISANRSQG